MKKNSVLISLLILIIFHSGFAQGRLMLNNDPCIVLKNNVFFVVDNSAVNAISTLGTGGNIISESEYNIVQWNIGTNVGLYSIPFSKSVGNKIPLSINIGASGVGAGRILFSTYAGLTWDNSTFMPSDVTHMGSYVGGPNNSSNVIDRFWIIDALSYTTKPTATITFSYLDSEHSAIGNSIVESSLFAQRFNSTVINDWDFLGVLGSANVISNTVSSGIVPAADFYRSWTLVNQSSPLPVELIEFKAECINEENIHFSWITASESNNNFFSVQASADGIFWNNIGIIDGAGNSSSVILYSYDYVNVSNYKYFRLKQEDLDGIVEYSNIIFLECNMESSEIIIYPNPNSGNFIMHSSLNVDIELVNSLGQVIKTISLSAGDDMQVSMSSLGKGIYYIFSKEKNIGKGKKIVVTN